MESIRKVYFPYHKFCDMESIRKVYFPYHNFCDMESIRKVYFPYHKYCDMECLRNWMNPNVILYLAVQWSCWPELLAECGLLRLVLQGERRVLPDV
jgi:hypothetical protein